MGGILLFAIPASRQHSVALLEWEDTERLPWGILLLFGGALSLAAALDQTGSVRLIGDLLGKYTAWGPVFITLIYIATMMFITEMMGGNCAYGSVCTGPVCDCRPHADGSGSIGPAGYDCLQLFLHATDSNPSQCHRFFQRTPGSTGYGKGRLVDELYFHRGHLTAGLYDYQMGSGVSYSVRKLSTGFIEAARKDRKPMVRKATRTLITPTAKKVHQEIEM